MNILNYWQTVSNRWLYLVAGVWIAGLMGFAFYLQYVKHEEPCPLCMIQRVVFVVMLCLFFIAAAHGPKRLGEWIYAGVIGLFALCGIGVAGRHIWLQHLPADQVPSCGPGLDYMLETMPMGDVLQKVLHGSGECAAKGWTFLTLGIPEWTLLCYVALGIWAVLIALRKKQIAST